MTERAVAEENLKQFKNTPKGNLVNFILERMKGPEFESDSILLPSIWEDGARRCPFFAYHCFRLTQTSLKTLHFEDLFKQGGINDNLEANDNSSINIPSSDTIPIGFHFETNYTEQTLATLEGFTVSNVTVKRHVDKEDELHGDVYEITFMIEDHSLSKKPDWRDKYTYARQYGTHVITIYFDGKKPAESRLKEVKAERQFYWETADGITKQWSEPEIKKIENRLNGLDIMMKSYWFWQIPPHLLRTWNKIDHERNEAVDELFLREEDLKQWQNSKLQKADA